jgi:hypothetical protein
MKRKSVAALVSLAVVSVALAGCYQTAYHGHDVGGPPSSRAVAVAKQACEINALAEERDAVVSTISSPEFGRDTEIKDHRFTILRDKLRSYSAEVEASYRFVTANCNSYNLCMAKNEYSEGSCMESRKAWTDSQEKFNNLAISIKEIEQEGMGYYNRHHGKGRHHRDDRGDRGDCRHLDCDDTQGGVFANGCCADDD